MTVGTKSILFGVHAFWLHPWFVAAAWWRLYGFPWDPRLWVAFFVHDLGYWGKSDMDGSGRWGGTEHPRLGAVFMYRWFGQPWWEFCMYHSRFWAKRHGKAPSRLCIADKLAITLVPAWLYLPLARVSGEIHEYMESARTGVYASMSLPSHDQWLWYQATQIYLRRWVEAHRDGQPDNWTPENL